MSSNPSVFIDAEPTLKSIAGYPQAIEEHNVLAFGIRQFFEREATESGAKEEFTSALIEYKNALFSENEKAIASARSTLYFLAGNKGVPVTSMPEFMQYVEAYTGAGNEIVRLQKAS